MGSVFFKQGLGESCFAEVGETQRLWETVQTKRIHGSQEWLLNRDPYNGLL